MPYHKLFHNFCVPSAEHQIVWMAISLALTLSYVTWVRQVLPDQGKVDRTDYWWQWLTGSECECDNREQFLDNSDFPAAAAICKVQIMSLSHINAFYGHKTVCIKYPTHDVEDNYKFSVDESPVCAPSPPHAAPDPVTSLDNVTPVPSLIVVCCSYMPT